jgi:hypothetical protein
MEVSGPIRWLHDSVDEWVFIVDTHLAAGMNEARATKALMTVLKAKVFVATDGPAWAGRGTPL